MLLSIPSLLSAQGTQTQSFETGPLSIAPLKSTIVFRQQGGPITYVIPSIRFRIKNVSALPVKIALDRYSIVATDNLGESLFRDFSVLASGIFMSGCRPFTDSYRNESNQFTTIEPNQFYDVQLTPSSKKEIMDQNQSFIQSHHPNSLNLTATLGVIEKNNSTRQISITLSDVPVYVSN